MSSAEHPDRNPRSRTVETPTIWLACVIYGAWLLLTWFYTQLPLLLVAPAGGWLVAWHGSLQHETIHGHPTRSSRINALIGAIPLALWLPYACYRRDHLAHHATPAITDPQRDPESRYLRDRQGIRGKLQRSIAAVQAPLIGRLVLGPPIEIGGFLMAEMRRLGRAPGAVLRDWGPHLVGVAIMLCWLRVCDVGFVGYMLLFVYPATALTLLRSFAEHRASALPGHRVAIVEKAGPFAMLFLNNNLHAAHHRAPGLPWYDLPGFYALHAAEIARDNGALVYRGYGAVVRRYAFRRHDRLVHPDHASAASNA